MIRYLANLSPGRIVLWCYLIWYLYFAWRYFDPAPGLWITSIGISAIIGIALLLSTWSKHSRLRSWVTFRLFLMPFCVSSFAALVKGLGFILVFSPKWQENATALGICAGFCAVVWVVKRVGVAGQTAPLPMGSEKEAAKSL